MPLSPFLEGSDWNSWRGNSLDGIVSETGYPRSWSAEHNIVWEAELPGPGNSTPVLSGNHLFVTCASEDGAQRGLLAFNRSSGEQLWHKTIPHGEDDPTHATNPWCAASPVTDGARVYVWYGSAGAAAYDFDGNELWRRDLGTFVHRWGHASSPRVYEDTVIFFGSPGPRVILAALDKYTGETVWERNLENVTSPPEDLYGSFVTPLLWNNNGRDELLIPLPGYLASFNPATGKEWWRCDGLGRLVYTDAMVGKDMILAFSGLKGPAIGLRIPDSKDHGNITETHRLWVNDTVLQRVGSGVIHDGLYYLCGRKGDLHAGDIYTGEILWTEKIREQAWSSIQMIDGKLWLTDQAAVTRIFEPGREFNEIRRNSMREKERTNSTIVPIGGELFLRTNDRLYAIGR